ncbi:hypothetical protein KC19_VG189400 [Ceratodon purpureus]|uniref:Uncharacterized protein n=1 Tax=Ceratodon purpureus TaxID=3225 RepID=A0A8T0HRF8_CERPU|nr:hypothetical protein KC19_VG189400 [Ceratodon purpureus]
MSGVRTPSTPGQSEANTPTQGNNIANTASVLSQQQGVMRNEEVISKIGGPSRTRGLLMASDSTDGSRSEESVVEKVVAEDVNVQSVPASDKAGSASNVGEVMVDDDMLNVVALEDFSDEDDSHLSEEKDDDARGILTPVWDIESTVANNGSDEESTTVISNSKSAVVTESPKPNTYTSPSNAVQFNGTTGSSDANIVGGVSADATVEDMEVDMQTEGYVDYRTCDVIVLSDDNVDDPMIYENQSLLRSMGNQVARVT